MCMDFIEGTPIMQLESELKKRGINPTGTIATMAKKYALQHITNSVNSFSRFIMIIFDSFINVDSIMQKGNLLIL